MVVENLFSKSVWYRHDCFPHVYFVTAFCLIHCCLQGDLLGQQPVSPQRVPVNDGTSNEIEFFAPQSHRNLAQYKVIAGPKAVELNSAKSPYDHLPMEVVTPQPYAYGWFGATSTAKWSRQFGYGRRYTQWSLK